jgi:hypothetical protein
MNGLQSILDRRLTYLRQRERSLSTTSTGGQRRVGCTAAGGELRMTWHKLIAYQQNSIERIDFRAHRLNLDP